MTAFQRSLKPEAITEEMGIHKEWYIQAKDQNLDTLPSFLKHLAEDYNHDYGTICHALAAAAIAATWAMDRSPSGGITGFQSGAVMWEFIRHWTGDDSPMRMLNYERMLWPQHAEQFAKKITKDTMDYLQERAAKQLKEHPDAHPDVIAHWQSIINGVVPFGYEIKKEE